VICHPSDLIAAFRDASRRFRMEREIPLYSYDGQLIQWVDQKRLDLLVSLNRIFRVVKHRKGHVARTTLRHMPGDPPPSLLSDYAGTRYSVIENLPHGRCWKLRKLDGRDEDGVPFSARNVFLQVVADCLVG
jgi:hypothetical protein